MADGRKNNGGARAGAGRKTDKDIEELRRVLDKAVPFDDRVEIFEQLNHRARSGDISAATLVLAYVYGKPKEKIESDVDTNMRIVIERDGIPSTTAYPTQGTAEDTE